MTLNSEGLKKEHPAVTKAREIGKKLASDPIFNSNKAAPTPTPVDGLEVVAWRVKDYADGWVLCSSEQQAATQSENGNLAQPLVTLSQASSVIAGLERELEVMAERQSVSAGWCHIWKKSSETAEARISSLEEENKRLREIVKAVAHIGVDFGFGPYELEHHFIEDARQALGDHNG